MSQIIKKFIGNDQVDGTKIHLDNNQAIRSRNAANSADVDILKLDASNVVQVTGALNASGNVSGANFSGSSSGTNSGDVTLAAVGASPSANGASLSGQVLTLQPADATHPGLLSIGSQTIGGAKTFSVAPLSSVDATAANELVRYSQLAALTNGLKPKAAVVVASTGNIDLAVAADPNPIDGHTIANGDRVLLWQQTADSENGIYDAVSATDPTTWVRSSDFDAPSEIPGAYTVAEFGTLYQGSVFVCLSSPGTIGVDPINFAQRAFSTGANQALSNLTSTAINQDLVFDSGAAANVKTKNDATADTQSLSIQSGDGSGFNSGQVVLSSGTSTAASGTTYVTTGDSTGGSSPGGTIITAGNNTAVGSGGVNVQTAPSVASGVINVTTGTASSNDSGTINLATGDAASGNAGAIVLTTGNGNATRGQIKLQDGSESLGAGAIWTLQSTSGYGKWQSAPAAAVNKKELVVLSGTDITNQYVDLTHVAKTDSILFQVQGQGSQLEGASYDYSVSYTGGAGGNTRITFLNGLATGGGSALVAGNVVLAQYQY